MQNKTKKLIITTLSVTKIAGYDATAFKIVIFRDIVYVKYNREMK